MFAYKGLVLLAGLFLAFETRKIKIKSLNESRFVAMSVYGVVVASITLTPIGFFLEEFPNVQYGILGIMMLLIMTLILGLVFVSKVSSKMYITFINDYTYCRCTGCIVIQKESIV